METLRIKKNAICGKNVGFVRIGRKDKLRIIPVEIWCYKYASRKLKDETHDSAENVNAELKKKYIYIYISISGLIIM